MSQVRGILLFIVLAALWGLSFPAIEVGLTALPPVLFAATRYDIAAVLLLGYAAVAARDWRPRTRRDVFAVVAGGVFLVAGNSLLFVGQQFTTGGVASIIYSLIPILTTVFARAFLPSERLSAWGLAGILLGLIGVGLIVRPDPSNLLAADVVGKGAVLAAAVSVSLGSVLVRRADPSLNDVAFTGWAMAAGAVILHTASAAAGESVPLDVSTAVVVALVYLAVFATGAAFLIYFLLLGRWGPLRVNLVSYLVPVVATLGGAVLLDEPITAFTVAGFLIILAGFALLNRPQLASLADRAIA